MKKSFSRSRSLPSSGFTLIELLVVIAIIAVLASVVLYAGSTAIKAAQRARASNTATQIQTAAMAYYTEYGIYPIPTGAAASADLLISDTDATNWKGMLYGLCGNVNPYDATPTAPGTAVPNARAITFLTLKNTDVDSNGGPKNPLPTGTSIYFNMAIDNDYDNIVGDTGTAQGKVPNFATSTTATMKYWTTGLSGGVIVWANCNGNTASTNPNFWVHAP